MLTVVGRDEEVGVATLDNMVIYLERQIPRARPHVGWLDRGITDVLRLHGASTAHLHVVEVTQRAGMRDGPREELTALARRVDGHLGAAAFVVPDRGFYASVVRSVITGVLFAVSPSSRTSSFAQVPDAVEWLRAECGRGPPLAEVELALAALRGG
ncbi:MAG: hypothetical protein AB7S26_32450 [Sandaracinaceae bacterium]